MNNTLGGTNVMVRIEPGQGDYVFDTFALRLVDEVQKRGEAVMGIFNRTKIVVNPGDTPEEVYEVFKQGGNEPGKAEKRAKYLASTEGVYDTEAKQLEQEMRDKKNALNKRTSQKLISEVGSMDFTNLEAILNWFYLFEKTEGSVDSEEGRQGIVEIFGAHGYEPGMNKGDMRSDNGDNVAKALIGEALYEIKKYGTLHQVLHSKIDDWKLKFID